MFALVKNNVVIECSPYIKWFPNTSFPDIGPSIEWMKENNIYKVNDTKPEFDDSLNHFAWVDTYYDIAADEVKLFTLTPKTQQEIDAEIEYKIQQNWDSLRQVRNELLDETDKIVIRYLEKNIEIPQEWLDYKQALRDLPSSTTNPYNVIWPVKPTHTFNVIQGM
jgi:hypothetical protein